jgi:hypothetical protein
MRKVRKLQMLGRCTWKSWKSWLEARNYLTLTIFSKDKAHSCDGRSAGVFAGDEADALR